MPTATGAIFESLDRELCCIRKGRLVFVWNRFSGDSLILTRDLAEDYFRCKTVLKRHAYKIQALESGACNNPKDISIETISVSFDSNPCENSCEYCIKPVKQYQEQRLSHKDIISFIKRNFPAIKAINVSGPDNREKYTFVRYARTQMSLKMSVNINISRLEQIRSISKIDILAGGSLEEFLQTSEKHLRKLNAYIVLPRGRYDYNKFLRLIPDLPLKSLTIEHDWLDASINAKEYCAFLAKLQEQCRFDVSGSWEKPVLNINKKITGPCKSYEGRSLSIQDTGRISVCGYVDGPKLDIEKKVFDKDSFAPLVLDTPCKDACRRCPIFGMCRGGCRILHSEKYKKAFDKQCEIKKTYFEIWAKKYLADKQNN
jgi:radical SAM protein with 4Fe4S-binding SPASM domain